MAKKKPKKAPAIARSKLHIAGLDAPLLLRESYQTVKKRMYDGQQWVEVVSKNGKRFVVNKNIIRVVYSLV